MDHSKKDRCKRQIRHCVRRVYISAVRGILCNSPRGINSLKEPVQCIFFHSHIGPWQQKGACHRKKTGDEGKPFSLNFFPLFFHADLPPVFSLSMLSISTLYS